MKLQPVNKVSSAQRGSFKQNFQNICRNYNSLKLKIKYNWRNNEKEITLMDILPENFCILAFHSVYPYMKTLFAGGWFNWVNYNEYVIVNCPAPEGIAMYVKPTNNNAAGNFQLEIMKNSCKCYKRYNLKESFILNYSGENLLKCEMLDRIIPFLAKFFSGGPFVTNLSCIYKGDVVKYQVKLEEIIQEDISYEKGIGRKIER